MTLTLEFQTAQLLSDFAKYLLKQNKKIRRFADKYPVGCVTVGSKKLIYINLSIVEIDQLVLAALMFPPCRITLGEFE